MARLVWIWLGKAVVATAIYNKIEDKYVSIYHVLNGVQDYLTILFTTVDLPKS